VCLFASSCVGGKGGAAGRFASAWAAATAPAPASSAPNEDAFSSSSDEDDDDDDDEEEENIGSKEEGKDMLDKTAPAASAEQPTASSISSSKLVRQGGSDAAAPPPPPPVSTNNSSSAGSGTIISSDKGRDGGSSGGGGGVVSGIVSEWDRALQSGQARHVTAPAFKAAVPTVLPASSAATSKATIISVHEPADGHGDRPFGEYDRGNTNTGYDDEYGPTPSIEVVPSIDDGDAEVTLAAGQDSEHPSRRGNATPVPATNREGRATPTVPAAPSTVSTPQRSNVAASLSASTAAGNDHLSSGVLPDVLMTMRLRIESLQLFDSDILKLAEPSLGGGSHSSSSSQLLRPLRQGQRYNRRRRRLPPTSPNFGPLLQLQGSDPPNDPNEYEDDESFDEEEDEDYRESLKRSSQQSISAAVLVSLAHKRYERRRLAAMELEKICRALLYQNETERIRAILLLLSDDYVRSTSEDARKGGVVALAACAIALKRGNSTSATASSTAIAGGTAASSHSSDPIIDECRDLILASVVHACQDHSSRVRYYATESLFNVVKVMPGMAVQHFFILFEILRSLYADVDADVRSGAELLDRKLKEVIVAAMNAGTFAPEFCLPVFCRFVYLRHKATKQLTLSWLQELHDKLLDQNPILEFLHLFVGGVFDMVADPTIAIRESAIYFLQSVLPKLLLSEDDPTGASCAMVDFDKILQSLVTTMEHPDPFVRKVSMYWMSRIVKSHCDPPPTAASANGLEDTLGAAAKPEPAPLSPDDEQASYNRAAESDGNGADSRSSRSSHRSQSMPPPPPPPLPLSTASISVRNSLPHILPGILLR
jgi:Vacuolar 14 Fab1-binding region